MRTAPRWLMLAFLVIPASASIAQRPASPAPINATLKERRAFQIFVGDLRRTLMTTTEAMPADKFGFAPDSTMGEFKGVRTFSRQVKHLAATNYILAAAALGQDPPADAGDEAGPDTVRSKDDILRYLNGSYDALDRAALAIGDESIPVRSSPISPLQGMNATRIALIAEALVHSYDHYGQMVEYLRMNGVVPPNSRK